VSKYEAPIGLAAAAHGIPAALIKSVMHVESAFNAAALSRKGAIGLMQLMPETARDMGVKDPFDPIENIGGGVRYLAFLLSRYGGDKVKALAAYNAGPGAVDKYGGVPPFAETRQYVRDVLFMEGEYARKESARKK
jgi:soluble lytic murein transglycosylase-like protein